VKCALSDTISRTITLPVAASVRLLREVYMRLAPKLVQALVNTILLSNALPACCELCEMSAWLLGAASPRMHH
jgi:hypothetical protein